MEAKKKIVLDHRIDFGERNNVFFEIFLIDSKLIEWRTLKPSAANNIGDWRSLREIKDFGSPKLQRILKNRVDYEFI